MKVFTLAGTALALSLSALYLAPAFAQNSPGLPNGLLGDDQFHFNDHPQMEFAASAPSAKFQSGKPSDARKKGDLGDPDGCNLKCPSADGSN
jgi:hypothetical protein